MNNKNVRYGEEDSFILEDNFIFLPMTTIVGIKINEGIVIGSDSQRTGGDYKELNVEKINSLNDILFTGAGDSDYIERVSQELEKHLALNTINKPWDVVSSFESILKMITTNYGFKEEWYSRFLFGIPLKENAKFQFSLYRIDNYHQFSIEIQKYYSIGSGSIFANYILKRVWEEGLSIANAVFLTIYIINEATTIDAYSSSPINISFITKNGISKVPEALIKDAQEHILKSDKRTIEFFKDNIFNRNIMEYTDDKIKKKKTK